MIGIIAISNDGVIGIDNTLPWHIPADMNEFRNRTFGGIVLMGRLTWESLPGRFRPLPGRRNCVLTGGVVQERDTEGIVQEWPSLLDFLDDIEQPGTQVFCIGGAKTYEACANYIDEWLVTKVEKTFGGDVEGLVRLNLKLEEFEEQPPHKLIPACDKHPSAYISRFIRKDC